MAKYRKKPVVIEAFQMTSKARWDNRDWPEWLNKAWNLDHEEDGAVYPRLGDELSIYTLEGVMTVTMGDWIIQGISGELYPCKPEIFEETYEAVDGEV